MADTNYIDYVQPAVSAEWLNEINDHVWHDTPVTGTTVHEATLIKNTPTGTIASTTVQGAINELESEKLTDSFLQSGMGAVARTITSKLKDIINVKDFGAVGNGTADDSTAFQNAIAFASGNPIYVPAGTYKIVTPLVYDTTGDGIVAGLKILGASKHLTKFDNQTAGVLFTVTSGDSATDYQENLILQDFSIVNTTNSLTTTGIKLTGIRGGLLDNITITDQAIHGIHFYSSSNDGSDNINIDVKQCEVSGSGNIGIYLQGVVAGVNAVINIDQCRVISNVGGIVFESTQNSTIKNSAIAYNTSYGVRLLEGTSYTKETVIYNNEFDSNVASQLQLDQATSTRISNNYFVVNTGYAVTSNINVNATASHTIIDQSLPRVASGFTGLSMYTINNSASDIQIINTNWSSWESTGNTKYNGITSSNFVVFEDGTYLYTPVRASGGGIKFPATQVTSSDVNTLDDYEEGTWTPVDASGAGLSMGASYAVYTKVGRLITINATLIFPTTGNTGNISIGGLPAAASVNAACGIMQTTATLGDACLIPTGTATIYIYGASLSRRTYANYSGVSAYISLSYIV